MNHADERYQQFVGQRAVLMRRVSAYQDRMWHKPHGRYKGWLACHLVNRWAIRKLQELATMGSDDAQAELEPGEP